MVAKRSRAKKPQPAKIETIDLKLEEDLASIEFEKVVTSQFSPVHDFEQNSELIGRIHALHEVEVMVKRTKKMQRLLEVLTPDGLRSVWESAALEKIFDDFDGLKGRIIKIVFIEKKKIRGGQHFKVFDVFLGKA